MFEIDAARREHPNGRRTETRGGGGGGGGGREKKRKKERSDRRDLSKGRRGVIGTKCTFIEMKDAWRWRIPLQMERDKITTSQLGEEF